jgi:signal peptidase I
MTVRIPKPLLVTLIVVFAAAGAVVAVLLLTKGESNKRLYRVPSESMEPTYDVGEVLKADTEKDPKRGDVVIFHPPVGAVKGLTCGISHAGDQVCPRPTVGEETRVTFIKRVVAMSGDRFAMRDGHSVVNGKTQKEPFIQDCGGGECTFSRPIRIPANYFFLVGDNRGASDDSRFWGPVPRAWIVGVIVRKP